MTTLYFRLLAIVHSRGFANSNVTRYINIEFWDNGLLWDVTTMGPVPTESEIAAVTQTQIDAALTTQRITRRDKELWTPQILALTRAVHDRLRAANVDNQTMGTFRAAVETHYTAIVES